MRQQPTRYVVKASQGPPQKLNGAKSQKWPHLWVRTSPKVGPGAPVGIPGLGYPFLLCLGKSFIVILDYALAI